MERTVAPLRRELVAAARATVRFETRPGVQLQIDFGERRVEIGGVATKVFFFVATLGYSRRLHVRAFGHEKQESWFAGMETAFLAFGGVPREVLLDNARALILHHDPASREVVLQSRLHAFAKHWGFRVRACAPYRARTKGKDERGVGYVKKNAIAGRSFASFAEMEAHLEAWTREIADRRIHGTTGEAPADRFARDEKQALRPLSSRIVRDRIFRRVVLRAYDERCAISGLKLINGGGRAEVAAAHIRPVEANGPDIVSNGLAVSGTAHWMFDRGLISLSDDLDILISRQTNDPDGVRAFINKDGRAIAPRRLIERPHPHFLRWHREHCFKP